MVDFTRPAARVVEYLPLEAVEYRHEEYTLNITVTRADEQVLLLFLLCWEQSKLAIYGPF